MTIRDLYRSSFVVITPVILLSRPKVGQLNLLRASVELCLHSVSGLGPVGLLGSASLHQAIKHVLRLFRPASSAILALFTKHYLSGFFN